MSQTRYAQYDFQTIGYTPPPPPSLNGGLYSGEPFEKGAPWANVPMIPDATYMTHVALTYGNEVTPGSTVQYPATRPGNSYVDWVGLSPYEGTAINSGPHNIFCAPCDGDQKKQCYCEDICPNHQTRLCNKDNCAAKVKQNSFSKYYYVQ